MCNCIKEKNENLSKRFAGCEGIEKITSLKDVSGKEILATFSTFSYKQLKPDSDEYYVKKYKGKLAHNFCPFCGVSYK